jgi:tol-pal system protein YbgF
MRIRARVGAVALAAALAAGGAGAGLFDDEEARKAILDLRAQVQRYDEQARAKLGELASAQAQLLDQIAALRRSLLDINNQLEAMRGENAALRGTNEQLAREVAELQRRQRDVGQAIDDRLRKLEPVKVSVDGNEFLVDPDEKRSYEETMAVLKGGDFDRAAAMLGAFLRRYPASGYSSAVRFWLGNAQYGRRDYREAINTFRAFVAQAPEHPRAPEALLALANSQAEMKDPKAARKTIEELMKNYPRSEAASAGKERLASLK